jgi:hypothetical protein
MKITESQIRQIIREELERAVNETHDDAGHDNIEVRVKPTSRGWAWKKMKNGKLIAKGTAKTEDAAWSAAEDAHEWSLPPMSTGTSAPDER